LSRVFSFRDLLLIPELKGYNEIELLDPKLDPLVNKYLGQLGFDLDYPIAYEPANHRDMQGKTGVGFRAVGEISINRAWINSPLCDATERMIAAAHTDIGLARELAALMGNSITFKDAELDGTPDEKEFPESQTEPDYEEKRAEIKQLEAIRDAIRGNAYNEDGSMKLPVREGV
jgi:hypothetical protein